MTKDGWRSGHISPNPMDKNEQYHKELQWSLERNQYPKNENGCEMLLDNMCFIQWKYGIENKPMVCQDYWCEDNNGNSEKK